MSANKYAAGTAVPISRSVAELDKLMTNHGASGFGYIHDHEIGRIQFVLQGRMVRLEVRRPDWKEFTKTPTGLVRSVDNAQKLAAQEECRRWRAIVLYVKAILVAAQDGAITADEAFLAHVVTPSNQTVTQWLLPQLDQAIAGGHMPKQLMS